MPNYIIRKTCLILYLTIWSCSHTILVRYVTIHWCNVNVNIVYERRVFICDGECATLHGTGRNWGICVVVTMTTWEFVIYSGKALRGLSSWFCVCTTHTHPHKHTHMCTCNILQFWFKPRVKASDSYDLLFGKVASSNLIRRTSEGPFQEDCR